MLNVRPKFFIAAFLVLVLLGCTSKPAVVPTKPVIKSIALVPATTPKTYSLRYVSSASMFIPIAAFAEREKSKEQAKILTERLSGGAFRPDEDLTNSVAEALRAKGYRVTVLKDVKRYADSPDSLEDDIEDLTRDTDALVHVQFYDVGVETPRRSNEYLPRMNVYVSTYIRQNSTYPFRQTFYYGIDASEGRSNSIIHDPKHTYPDFDAMINSIDLVRSNFRVGATKVGERLAEQVHLAIK
jgi:hypothetical protein